MPDTYTVEVLKTKDATPSSHVIQVEKPEGYEFKAGQWSLVHVQVDDHWAKRPLSIAASPNREYLEFCTRDNPHSDFKRNFNRLKPGDKVKITDAKGNFTLDERDEAIVYLSGGIGITPLKSMIEYADEENIARRQLLIYSARRRAEITYREQLDARDEKNPRLRVVYTVTRESPDRVPDRYDIGRIDHDLIERNVPFDEAPSFYICGPPQMVDAMEELLKDFDVPPERIEQERFSGY